MKREAVIFFLTVVLALLPLISAKAVCSDGNKTISDTDGINVNDARSINGIKIVVISAEDIRVFKRYMADVFVDGDKVKVINTTSNEIVFSSGNYNATLISTSSGKAKIQVGGDEKELEVEEFGTINGFDVILLESTLSSGGTSGSATFLIGAKRVSFSNDKNPSEIVNMGGNNYLIELFSASDSKASFIVSKCENGEIQEQSTAQNVTEGKINITSNSTINSLIGNNNSLKEENTSSETQITLEEANRRRRELELGINSSSGNASSLGGKLGKVEGAGKLIFFVFIGLLIIIVAYIFIRMKINGKGSKKV